MTTLTVPVGRPISPRVKAQLVYVGSALTISLGALATGSRCLAATGSPVPSLPPSAFSSSRSSSLAPSPSAVAAGALSAYPPA